MIEISQIKGNWSRTLIQSLRRAIYSLTDPISRITEHETSDYFNISIVCNGKPEPAEDQTQKNLRGLIENKPVLKIQGEFNSKKDAFIFTEGEDKNSKVELNLNDAKIKGLWIWKNKFGNKQAKDEENKNYECGNFEFHFYFFDFSRKISGKYELSPPQKKILKEHRIYLYRDGVRVYPYGDPDDDWLQMDVFRGTGRVGHFFSNDQVVGWIDISQNYNPDLRDKTNREGLIEKGNAVYDFRVCPT